MAFAPPGGQHISGAVTVQIRDEHGIVGGSAYRKSLPTCTGLPWIAIPPRACYYVHKPVAINVGGVHEHRLEGSFIVNDMTTPARAAARRSACLIDPKLYRLMLARPVGAERLAIVGGGPDVPVERSLDRLAAVVDRDDPDIHAEPEQPSGDLGGNGAEACVAEVAEDE